MELPAFVTKHLNRIAENEGFIDGFTVEHEAGSKVGDGFMADMVSLRLVGSRKNASGELLQDKLALICKLKPANAARLEQFSTDKVFKREVFVYNTLLPQIDAFQKEHNVPSELRFSSFPKCYAAAHEDGPESIIIMEDLRAKGFSLWDKLKPAKFENVKLLLEQLGRLHGLSIAIREQKPDIFKVLQDLPDIMKEMTQTPILKSMMSSAYARAAKILDDPQDVELMTRLNKEYVPLLLAAMQQNEFGVLNHGDCWSNNMMYIVENVRKSISN